MTTFDPSGFSKGTHAYEVATRVKSCSASSKKYKDTALHAHKFVIYQELKYHFTTITCLAYFKANGKQGDNCGGCVGFDMQCSCRSGERWANKDHRRHAMGVTPMYTL